MKKFTRKIEDFICGNCGEKVVGNGYTNHCPNCLYSKHVDVNPGDRQATCGGLMAPIETFQDHGQWKLAQQCQVCEFKRTNRVDKADNFEVVIALSQKT